MLKVLNTIKIESLWETGFTLRDGTYYNYFGRSNSLRGYVLTSPILTISYGVQVLGKLTSLKLP